jgi:hypothetical protein
VTNAYEWSVIVVKTQPAHVRETVVRVYRFIRGLIEVDAVHFVVRDRMQDGVIVSFRFRIESADADATKAAIRRELERDTIVDFAIDPPVSHPLHKFAVWPWNIAVQQRGAEKFSKFTEYLSKLSSIVVDMAEHDYFTSRERAEITHVIAWMLGLAECGILRVKGTKGVDIGYYDRIENTTHPYLTYRFADNP